jgi:four helix bundle protein
MNYRKLKAYQMAFCLSVQIHDITRNFPKAEQYSLTDQIRKSSRSVCASIAEGYRKRRYPKHFINKLSDADSENSETMVWLEFSEVFKYIDNDLFNELSTKCSEIGYLLHYMMKNPDKYL